MRGWVLATSVGSAITFAISNRVWAATLLPPQEGIMGLFVPSVSILPLFVFAGISGLVLGVAQWPILRAKLPQAFWWIPLSGIGMLGESLFVGVLKSTMGPMGIDVSASGLNPVYWAIAAIGVVFYAAITGVFLVRCLRQRS
jgi:hypothetical protein